jgi:hypothetical protein
MVIHWMLERGEVIRSWFGHWYAVSGSCHVTMLSTPPQFRV